MTEPIFYVAALVFLLTIGLSVDRLGTGAGGRSWALAWVSLYLAGMFAALDLHYPAVGFIYPPLVTMFPALLFIGAREYAGTPVKSWFMPTAIAVALARGALEPVTAPSFTHTIGALCVTAGALAASHTLLRRPRIDRWERLLAFGLLSLPVAAIIFAYWRIAETPSAPAFTLWILVGVFVGFSQICALMSRLTRRSVRQHSVLAALIESVPIGLALTDTDGNVRTMNSELARQLQLANPEKQIGRPFVEMADRLRSLVEPDVARSMARARDRVANSEDGLGEMEFRFMDGRVANGAARVVRSPSGEALGQVWYLVDVTEERRLDRELQQSRQLEVLGSLAGGVAHDFNNKLTAILGNASLLNESLEADDPNREILGDLESAAEYCAELTRDLLTFARQTPRSPAAIDLAEFLPELATELRADLRDGVALEFEVATDCPPIEADRVQLERVLTNLVINARDSIDAAGTIRISASRDASGASRWVELKVRDDGTGMDSETRERIFDPFYTTKEVGEGTGLGLAIVIGIVASHGGEVSVESAPGRGTLVTSTWPVSHPGGLRGARSASEAETIRGTETVLVVDDEAPVRRFIRATLENAGFRTLEAESGAAAIDVFEQHESAIELVLVDLAMPGLSGTEVVAHIRQKRPELPVLLMSGNLELAREAIDSLDVESIAKPFRSRSLLQSARRAIDGESPDPLN